MNIEETFTLDAPVPQVYAFLSDVHRVAACVPGVGDVTQREDGAYEATLQIQMGPIKAAFAGEVTLTTTENPYRIEAHGRGRDKRSGSRAEVLFGGELEPEGDAATRVATSADITIRGRLGQFGTGVIRATATEVIRDFVACANGVLGEERAPAGSGAPLPAAMASAGSNTSATSEPEPPTTSSSPPSPPPAPTHSSTVSLGLVFRILVGVVRNAVRAVVRRLRGKRG
jgi:uncharacterized protein